MKYAFVCLSIGVIWLAIILMALTVPGTNLIFMHRVALVVTVVFFWIGFRSR